MNKKSDRFMENENLKTATFAGGCFWCTEAVFQRLEGVEKIISGFTGGIIKNPPYREVITGRTGHAEGIQLLYNENKISYEDLLMIFFATHDPTTLNRQQNDIGTQYRSAIFYHDIEQKNTANAVIKELEKQKIFSDPIVTEVNEATAFYEAEEAHQDYYNQHKQQPYCQYIIDPKIAKLNKYFSEKLKRN